MQQRAKHFEGGGFARAIGAEKTKDFAAGHGQINALDSLDYLLARNEFSRQATRLDRQIGHLEAPVPFDRVPP